MITLPAAHAAGVRRFWMRAQSFLHVENAMVHSKPTTYMPPPKRPYAATDPAPAAAAASPAPANPADAIALLPVPAHAPVLAFGAAVPAAAACVAPAAAPVEGAAMPPSPGRNRQLFLATVTPQHMTCNLSNAVVGLGVKHNLVAIIIASFPIQNGPPARRHITVCDAHGTTGLTVWNADVHKFPKEVLGGVVTISRASVSLYQGKKSLVLSKDSLLVVNTTTPSLMAEWWSQLALQSPLSLPAVLVTADNSIINVFGVLAFFSHDTKEINGQVRCITSFHLASQTAKFQVRGWDLEPAIVETIERLRDRVVQVRRVRVTCFAEQKIGEYLDSPLGSTLTLFDNDELARFWTD